MIEKQLSQPLWIKIAAPSLVAEGSCIRGEVCFESTAQIFGIVEGNVLQQSTDSLVIGKTGWVKGNIQSTGPLIVAGRVDGDVVSQTRVQLLESSVAKGKIMAPCVEIRAGAFFDGDLEVNPTASALHLVPPKQVAA